MHQLVLYFCAPAHPTLLITLSRGWATVVRPSGIISGLKRAMTSNTLSQLWLSGPETHPILAPSFLGMFWSSYLISLIHPKFRQDHLLQNQIVMFLLGVCSLSAGDVTLLPGWIRAAFNVRQHVLDLISDWFHSTTLFARLSRSSWCILCEQTVVLWDAMFKAVWINQSILTPIN